MRFLASLFLLLVQFAQPVSSGGIGWQVSTQTVNGEGRSFTYGYGGEVLSETIPSFGIRTYVNGSVDHVLWSFDGNDMYAANLWLADLNGSVYGLTSAAGSVLERQRYDSAYGKGVFTDPAGSPIFQSTRGSRLGFQGRTNLPEFGLQNFRNRFYDPSIGRFLSRDPLGLIDGPAVYAFCGGDPVNRTDPMGTIVHVAGAVWEGVPGGMGYVASELLSRMIASPEDFRFSSVANMGQMLNDAQLQGRFAGRMGIALGEVYAAARQRAGQEAANAASDMAVLQGQQTGGVTAMPGELKQSVEYRNTERWAQSWQERLDLEHDIKGLQDAGVNTFSAAAVPMLRRAPVLNLPITIGEVVEGISTRGQDLGRQLERVERFERGVSAGLEVGSMIALKVLPGAKLEARKVPNPHGRVGGLRHQAYVEDIVRDVEKRGLVARTEVRVELGDGTVRSVDVVGVDPKTKMVVEQYQVGATTKSGIPVARERRAMEDIDRATTIDTRFIPYDK